MRAVWSLWTKPLRGSRHPGWLTEKHHLLSWVLSFETARQHYSKTCLVTDDAGARFLVDGLGLEFSQVSLQLNTLSHYDPDWWALGKLLSYTLQTQPFVHIDNDVFLWKPLPDRLERAQVFAQNPEWQEYGASFYRPELIEHLIYSAGGWVPEEFSHYIHIWGSLRAESCGILGGCRTDFIRYYAQLALDFIGHPRNQSVWKALGYMDEHFILFEQYLLAACIDFHKMRKQSNYCDIEIAYLFSSYEDALKNAANVGFTHLLSHAKRNPKVLDQLEERVKTSYPHRYKRCLELLEAL